MALKRRQLLASAAAFAGLTLGARWARADRPRLRVTRHRIPWPGERLLRVVQVTDVHVGWGTPVEMLSDVSEVAWQAEPDLVVLTGDYVNRSLTHGDALRAFVTSLPKPVIATLGNHDHWAGADDVKKVLELGGASVLANQHSGIDGLGWSLPVIGVDDGFSRHADVQASFTGVDQPERALVLSHYPATTVEIQHKGAPLVLCGHTHGGQFNMGKLTEAMMSFAGNPYVHGWYELDHTAMYVSAGVGQSIDGLRGGDSAVAEVAVYDLDPSASSRESKSYRVR